MNQKLDSSIFEKEAQKVEQKTKVAIEILNIIKDIDVNRLSPMAAFDLIIDLTSKTKGDE